MSASPNLPEPSGKPPENGAANAARAPTPNALPHASARRHFGFSWVWLLPLGALALVAYLLYGLAAERGPLISISFDTADGLVAQQTQVRYKAVTLGTVQQIDLADDRSHVVARVRMNEQAEALLSDKTRFWVVRPRLNGGLAALQSGLETLISGAYVAMDPGTPAGSKQTQFRGLEKPPSVRSDQPGKVYFLEADALSGLDEGAPIFYRGVNVGEVLSYQLSKANVSLRVFVNAPYDRQVTNQTRFWNSSGVRLDMGADGLRLELQSLKSLLSGGIAFHDPPKAESVPPAAPEAHFRLYPNEAQAEVGFYGRTIPYVSYFQSSVRGLMQGAQVHMFGQPLGTVTGIKLVNDPRVTHHGELAIRVAYVLQPERTLEQRDEAALTADGIGKLVGEQLRVVLETTSLITGQKALSLEYVPGAKSAVLSREGDALVLPSETRDLQDLSGSLAEVANKLNRIPFEQMAENANQTLASLRHAVGGPELARAIVSLDATLRETGALAREARAGLKPALSALPRISRELERAVDGANAAIGQAGYGSDSTVQRNLERMMSQVADAARSIRLLAEYLDRHPESLVRGRAEGEP